MQPIIDFLRTLFDADKLIILLSTVLTSWQSYALLFAIVFAETGLLIGFALPGDSLLFTVGVVAGAGKLDLLTINVLLSVAAIVGDGVGYVLGMKAGPHVFNKPDSRFFKQDHLRKTREFYLKHGGKTIIYARFIPIIRTFAPFVAGVAQMPYLRFLFFNVFGGIGWVASMTVSGYLLGGVPIIRRHFEKVVIGIVLLSVMPIVIEYIKHRRSQTGTVAAPIPEGGD